MLAGGEENLIPMSERSKDEVREIARRGGIKSGEVRRERKKMREQAELLLSLPFQDYQNADGESVLAKFKKITGIEDVSDIDNQMAMLIAMWQMSLNGEASGVSAFNSLRELVGEKKTDVNLNGGVNINFDGESEIED